MTQTIFKTCLKNCGKFWNPIELQVKNCSSLCMYLNFNHGILLKISVAHFKINLNCAQLKSKQESSNTVFRAESSLAQNCHLLQMGYDYQTFSTFLGEEKYKEKDEERTNAKNHTSCHIYKSERWSFSSFESMQDTPPKKSAFRPIV